MKQGQRLDVEGNPILLGLHLEKAIILETQGGVFVNEPSDEEERIPVV